MKCPSCLAEVPEGSRFCPACAAPLAAAAEDSAPRPDAPTATAPEGGLPTPSTGPSEASRTSSATGSDGGRFLPGTLLASRYRIVGLLGRGGMGEVYRADDLKLGQPMALKFLPEAMESDEEWLTRFLNEVKIARQVSNPHVCRVYDVGEVDGHHFLSMEFIDGEDLSSLLRRIGRLPQDKAVQIARQICAGLASAHDQGILHRDLKPANVMIDGRGNAKITDFGLAGLAEAMTGEDAMSGTPAYMAPEQLAGREVSVRSDIYALGLVLYQLFTGKRAFRADSTAELSRLHRESTPGRPSSVVKAIDPAVERIILRCLEKDPRDRPASALEVSAALPGGDPLAAILAAGETPSPEMVAAAGEKGILAPRIAFGLLLAGAVLTAVFVSLANDYQLSSQVPLDKPREVLIDRAKEVLATLGVDRTNAVDTAHGFRRDADVVRYLEKPVQGTDPWEMIRSARPAVVQFWYRQSPRELLALRNSYTIVSWGDPPRSLSGMAAVRLDTRGRLTEYYRVPPQTEEEMAAGPATAEPDWLPLFRAAGLERESFSTTRSTWVPPVFSDVRAAWTGTLPELPGMEVRLEAAAYRGQPIYFRLIGPWSRPERESAFERSARGRASDVVGAVLFLILFAAGLWIARRNLHAGRGDLPGAFRLAVFMFVLHSIVWLLWSHHTGRFTQELGTFITASGMALFLSVMAWAIYIALEPYVRRHDPERIIGWSRLLAGRFKDPLVGRDVLIGAMVGSAIALLEILTVALGRWVGGTAELPASFSTQLRLGPRVALGSLLRGLPDATFGAMFLVFFFFLAQRVLPWRWLTGSLLAAVLTLSFSAQKDFSYASLLCSAIASVLIVLILMRHGLLTLIATLFFAFSMLNLPIPTEPAAWYGHNSWLILVGLSALAIYAFKTALGGRRVFGEVLLGD